jgi:hypothetical protein
LTSESFSAEFGARCARADTITGVSGLQGIANSICQLQGVASADCFNVTWQWTCIFGAVELGMSQVKNLEEAWCVVPPL